MKTLGQMIPKRAMIRLLVVMAVLAGSLSPLVGGFVSTADAGEPVKCNAGRGNGSEPDVENDCDPGNSAGRNQGGD